MYIVASRKKRSFGSVPFAR